MDDTRSARSTRARSATRARGRRAAGLLGLLGLVLTLVPAAVLAPAAAATTGQPAYLRPAHLVPELGAMDIRLSPFSDEGGATGQDQRPLLETTASYGAVGSYEPMPAGSYAVSVRPAGTPVSEPPLLSLTIDLGAGQAYTVAGLGTKDDPRLELLGDDLTPPGDGSARVRLLAASLAAPTVDVQAESGPQLGRGVSLGSPTGYRSAPAGPWTVTARGGTTSGSTDLVLAGGSVYTLLVLDDATSAGPARLVVEPVLDAVGTGTTPTGGAATGFGGSAAGAGVELVPLGVLAVTLALTGVTALGLARAVRDRPALRRGARHVRG